MKKENNKRDIRAISILGSAGHGKSTTIREIKREFNELGYTVIQFSFSKTLKKNVASMLGDELPLQERLQKMDDLKDNHPDIKIVGDINTRELMQITGTEVYRNIHPNIHIKYSAQEILREIEKTDGNIIILSDDVRFKNELNFMLELGDGDVVEKLRGISNINCEIPSMLNIHDIFAKNIDGYRESKDRQKVMSISADIFESLNSLRLDSRGNEINIQVDGCVKDIRENKPGEDGVIYIFRPILPEGHTNNENLVDDIISYTGIDVEEVNNIKNYYEKNGVDWNSENINKYGYLRANPHHRSETDLNDVRPKPLTVEPIKNEGAYLRFKSTIKKIVNNMIPESKRKIKRHP